VSSAQSAGSAQSARISGCYLYPVKGMTAQPTETLQLAPGQSALGDRAFVFAFGNAERVGPLGWVSKRQSVTLLNTPELPRIAARYDAAARRLTLAFDGAERAAEIDDQRQRTALADWLAEIVHSFAENPLRGRPEREPLVLLGDGSSRYTDRGPTQVSLAGRDSLSGLANAAGVDVDFRRFRLNLALDGAAAWSEFEWVGRRARIGAAVELELTARLQRCNAINASPSGAGRDTELMSVLRSRFGHLDFGVEANVRSGGRVAVGDAVQLVRES